MREGEGRGGEEEGEGEEREECGGSHWRRSRSEARAWGVKLPPCCFGGNGRN